MALLSPDKACVGVDIGRTRYDGTRLTDVPPAHAALLRQAGYVESGPAGPARSAGYVCPRCGFHAHFKTCGRCGGPCQRPE